VIGRIRNAGNTTKGFLYALVGTLFFSANYVTVKYGVRGFSPDTFSIVWTASAAFWIFLVLAVTGRARRLRLPAGAWPRVALLGLFCGATMILAWHGLSLLDPTFASFLWRFQPLTAILLGALVLGDRLRAAEVVFVGLMLFGGLVSAWGSWRIVGAGALLTLLACVTTTGQFYLGRTRVDTIHPDVLAFYRVLLGMIVIIIWNAATGRFEVKADASHWLVTCFGALGGPCLGYLAFFRSYRCWDFSRTSIVYTVQPLMVLPLALIFLRMVPTRGQLLGGVIIMLGALGLAWLHARRRKPA